MEKQLPLIEKRSALKESVTGGDIEGVKILIEDLGYEGSKNLGLLHMTVLTNNLSIAKILLDENFEFLKERNSNGSTPLDLADSIYYRKEMGILLVHSAMEHDPFPRKEVYFATTLNRELPSKNFSSLSYFDKLIKKDNNKHTFQEKHFINEKGNILPPQIKNDPENILDESSILSDSKNDPNKRKKEHTLTTQEKHATNEKENKITPINKRPRPNKESKKNNKRMKSSM